jgi:hypothetical protein
MEPTKPDPKKQPPQPEGKRMIALYFAAMIDLPIESVNGGTKKVHAKENRTITQLQNGDYRIIETYKDRASVVLDVPRQMAVGQPAL